MFDQIHFGLYDIIENKLICFKNNKADRGLIKFGYPNALIWTFHTDFLTTKKSLKIQNQEHKLKRWFCTKNQSSKFFLKISWINLSKKYLL